MLYEVITDLVRGMPDRAEGLEAAPDLAVGIEAVVGRALRAGTWFVRRGGLSVTLGEPVEPAGTDWQAAIALRDKVRQIMLAGCGEPDLVEGAEADKPDERADGLPPA